MENLKYKLKLKDSANLKPHLKETVQAILDGKTTEKVLAKSLGLKGRNGVKTRLRDIYNEIEEQTGTRPRDKIGIILSLKKEISREKSG